MGRSSEMALSLHTLVVSVLIAVQMVEMVAAAEVNADKPQCIYLGTLEYSQRESPLDGTDAGLILEIKSAYMSKAAYTLSAGNLSTCPSPRPHSNPLLSGRSHSRTRPPTLSGIPLVIGAA
eukprot:m.245249 g.245249  ORF g.245249 m.245249 type:complete len:121 (+) comp26399_c0_seq1:125-487(+)